ncbi:MAG: TlpA disulfide reductase family protein, partial [Ginsengibacter sp.]
DQEGMDKIDQEFDKLTDEKNENVYGRYLTGNPNSPIALYVLNQYAGYDLNVPKMEPLFNRLSAKNKKSPAGIAFSERLELARKTAVGAMAMEFTQNDTLGIPVSLASLRGKYVLIDFWASWCGPCRAENPNVVKTFNEYKDKGFTVLGISLDQPGKHQAWMDAIHKDNLTWTQLSDLKGWKNEVSTMYGIRAIPQNLLLDPSGKIIAKNIRGEELPKTLKSMIK